MENKKNEIKMYDGKVWGFEVSEYAKEHGYLDYRTLSEMVGDMILCNDITKIFFNNETYFEIENGLDYDEENDYYEDIYQYFIISAHGAEILEKYTNEIVYYCSELDMYVWGITHFGTSWDYVLTDIKLIKE